MSFHFLSFVRYSTLPQEHKKAIDKQRRDAIFVQERVAEEREAHKGAAAGAAGDAAGSSGGGSSSVAKKARAKLPKDLSVAAVRPFRPQVHGCTIWFEPSSARVRLPRAFAERKTSTSWPREPSEHVAVMNCLRWAWTQAKDTLKMECPWPEILA